MFRFEFCMALLNYITPHDTDNIVTHWCPANKRGRDSLLYIYSTECASICNLMRTCRCGQCGCRDGMRIALRMQDRWSLKITCAVCFHRQDWAELQTWFALLRAHTYVCAVCCPAPELILCAASHAFVLSRHILDVRNTRARFHTQV